MTRERMKGKSMKPNLNFYQTPNFLIVKISSDIGYKETELVTELFLF